jgi:hypothetical protein
VDFLSGMTDEERAAYEEKKFKLRKAMADGKLEDEMEQASPNNSCKDVKRSIQEKHVLSSTNLIIC